MLPNRMNLSKIVEEQLKRLKAQTGITPNVAARIAFFKSIESGHEFDANIEHRLDGTLVLDKITWLGKTQQATELLLKIRYPELESKKLQAAWSSHVEYGIASLRNEKTLYSFGYRLLD
ncbi:DNA sulfur modification protein DndE [Pseudidiomarina sp.]|uniref:DNA sulfur modification protein DndE n=1 Tax=Pseudidiomarina sp. TaxID=2081707 RepID=UPI003A97078C